MKTLLKTLVIILLLGLTFSLQSCNKDYDCITGQSYSCINNDIKYRAIFYEGVCTIIIGKTIQEYDYIFVNGDISLYEHNYYRYNVELHVISYDTVKLILNSDLVLTLQHE